MGILNGENTKEKYLTIKHNFISTHNISLQTNVHISKISFFSLYSFFFNSSMV